jgi:thiol-disulfide isomerase/thioredoxin
MIARSSWRRRFLLAALLAPAALSCRPASARDVMLRPWPGKTPAPAFELVDRDGKLWNADSMRGKIVVLNFWASWCGPCVDELPILNDLATGAHAGRGDLVVLGVNFKESTPTIDRFVQRHPFRYPILVDRTGELFKKWTNGIMPTTVLIDRQGRPRWRVIGELDANDPAFGKALDGMIAQGPPPAGRTNREAGESASNGRQMTATDNSNRQQQQITATGSSNR